MVTGHCEIDGKPIKEYAGLPHGEFQKLVRRKIDPFYGLDLDSPIKWKVRVRLTTIDYEDKIVEAPNEKEAEKIALTKWCGWDDVEIVDCKPVIEDE